MLSLQRNERVTYLNLSHNDFGHEGAVALGRAIGDTFLLADRTARSVIDYWHDSVVRPPCLSACVAVHCG